MKKIDKVVLSFLKKKIGDKFLENFIDDNGSEFILFILETIALLLVLTANAIFYSKIMETIFMSYLVSYFIESIIFIKYLINRTRSVIAFTKIQEDCKQLIKYINEHKHILYIRSKLYEIDCRIDSYLSYSMNYEIGSITQIKAIIGQIKLELSDLNISDKEASLKLLNNIKIMYSNFSSSRTILDDLTYYTT